MPLLPQIQITQEFCDEITIKDVTPPYSAEYTGGYGVINVDADQIVKVKITFDFGRDRKYEYVTPYNQTKEDIIVEASNFPLKKFDIAPCGNCGTTTLEFDADDRMREFPQGCINIFLQWFSVNEKLEASKAVKFISTCVHDKLLVELADRITTPNADGDYNMLPDKREEIMRNLILSWQKLQIMETTDGCDCDCIAGRIKQIGLYLKSIKL